MLTVQSDNSDHPNSPDIKKALEKAGFKNVSTDWCQTRMSNAIVGGTDSGTTLDLDSDDEEDPGDE